MSTAAPQDKTAEDREAERVVEERQRRREQGEQAAQEAGERSTNDVLKAAQDGKEVAPEEVKGALEFFLATKDQAEAAAEPRELKLNLGTAEDPQWVRWVIGPIEDNEITRIRKASVKGTRVQRRRGDAEVDEFLVSRKIVAQGTVDPDPADLAREMAMVDPADAIGAFFGRYGKTGLVTQLSGEILAISGWDDDDIQEVDAARG